MLENLKQEVCELNLELPRNGLVAWTSGNVSGRDPETGLIAIKPSGIRYSDLKPDHMAIVNASGEVVEGQFKPSTDTATHLYVYRNRPDVMGLVHTHSIYATAWAAVGRAIPVCLTAHADVFGGPIPCGPYAEIGGEAIGEVIVRHIGDSSAILLMNHGAFTIGDTPEHALRAAIMLEEVARTMTISFSIGVPVEIPAAEVARQHAVYMSSYGQR